MAQTDQRTPATTGTRERTPDRPVFVPPADIYETQNNIVVLAEMPGVAPDGVDITLERRVLTPAAAMPAMSTPVTNASTTNIPMVITNAFSHCPRT